MQTAPILVTGAAGRVGSISPAVVEMLIAQGRAVRAMVRQRDERSQRLERLGAEVVVGNLLELDDLHRAFEGCPDVYFSMSVGPAYLEATANAVAVAREHAVRAFVNMSQMSVSQMSVTSTTPSPQHKHHWLAEQLVAWSGIPAVTLRPTAFMDVFFRRFAAPGIRQQGELRLPFGRGRTSPIAAWDVARVVAAVLLDPERHVGQVHELTGPRVQDLDGIAQEYARALGREIRYLDVPPGPWEAELARGASTPHLAAHLIAMAALHRDNRYDRLTDTVERLTGVPPMSVEDFVRRHAADFSPTASH
jgi:uncharacterized protein YbjT (DUF2867 family)